MSFKENNMSDIKYLYECILSCIEGLENKNPELFNNKNFSVILSQVFANLLCSIFENSNIDKEEFLRFLSLTWDDNKNKKCLN